MSHNPDEHHEEKSQLVEGRDYIVRMDLYERVNHLINIISVVTLVTTGFMLKIPEDWIAVLGSSGRTVFLVRGFVHRMAGVLLISGFVYHLGWLVLSHHGRKYIMEMLPTLKDGIDAVQNIMYYLGVREEPPEFDKFDYKAKVEYLALLAGNTLICCTGVILWSEMYWNKFILDIAILIHGMEATLASLAIMTWHFYVVLWKPGVFPGHLGMPFHGRMPLGELKEEHPLYYKKLVEAGEIEPLPEGAHFEHHGPTGFTGFLTRVAVFITLPVCLMFGFALLKMLFFPPKYEVAKDEKAKTILANVLDTPKADMLAGHFHNIDDYMEPQLSDPPLCLQCHGSFPHTHSVSIRSLMNMHAYFLACEVCHINKDQDPAGSRIEYVWYDNITDSPVMSPDMEGKFGTYDARIIPVIPMAATGEYERLDRAVKDPIAEDYMKRRDSLTPAQQARAKAVIHGRLSKTPVMCKQCHIDKDEKAYLNFRQLGYSPERAKDLQNTEVADMITNYMDFYFPTILDHDLMKQRRKQELMQSQEK